jgi:hypothetical protein
MGSTNQWWVNTLCFGGYEPSVSVPVSKNRIWTSSTFQNQNVNQKCFKTSKLMKRGECCTNLAAKLWESREWVRKMGFETHIWSKRAELCEDPNSMHPQKCTSTDLAKWAYKSEQELQTLKSPLFFYPIFPSFFICFEQSKRLWVWQAKLYVYKLFEV